MCKHAHTYTHTYTHTYVHTHVYTQTCTLTYVDTNTIHTYMACINAYTHTHTYTHTQTHTHIHTNIHAYIHTYTHTYTHRTERRWRPQAIINDTFSPIFQNLGTYTLGTEPTKHALRDIQQHMRRYGHLDGVVCLRPPAVCEFAWNLGVPSVVYVAERLERGREGTRNWRQVW